MANYSVLLDSLAAILAQREFWENAWMGRSDMTVGVCRRCTDEVDAIDENTHPSNRLFQTPVQVSALSASLSNAAGHHASPVGSNAKERKQRHSVAAD